MPAAGAAAGGTVARLHIIVDHSLVVVIANNITAITAAAVPSGPAAAGVLLLTGADGAGSSQLTAHADVWSLETANNA